MEGATYQHEDSAKKGNVVAFKGYHACVQQSDGRQVRVGDPTLKVSADTRAQYVAAATKAQYELTRDPGSSAKKAEVERLKKATGCKGNCVIIEALKYADPNNIFAVGVVHLLIRGVVCKFVQYITRALPKAKKKTNTEDEAGSSSAARIQRMAKWPRR